MANPGRMLLLTLPVVLGGAAWLVAENHALEPRGPDAPQDHEDRFKRDQEKLVGPWIYDDLQAGFAEARKTGKPVLIVFR